MSKEAEELKSAVSFRIVAEDGEVVAEGGPFAEWILPPEGKVWTKGGRPIPDPFAQED